MGKYSEYEHQFKMSTGVVVWLCWGALALVALWMGGSMVLITKRIKLHHAEAIYLKSSIARRRAVSQEMKAAVVVKKKHIDLNLLRQLALKAAIQSMELRLRSAYPHLSEDFILKLDVLLRSVDEHESIQNLERIEELVLLHNQSFIDDLSRENGALSRQELLICTLLQLGLNNDELVALTGKSQEALSMAKLRLKRKLKGNQHWWA